MEYTDPEFIESRLPHRAPFLWLDRITSLTDTEVAAETLIRSELDVFKGHYPEYPIMPGVLLCEAVFQAGALLIAECIKDQDWDGIPVLTRITNAKFKREVRPDDLIEITATLKERLSSAWFMKGVVRVSGKVAVKVEFSCALKTEG
jgi:3-hydroxyacyl-[acyl-carrier-protein] dehydratase